MSTVMTRPSRRTPTTYFWQGYPNFGDRLTPLLMAHFADLHVTHAPIGRAELISVGSLLHLVPWGWEGIIAGTGKLFDREEPTTSRANIIGLRGPLTARNRKGDYALGDPGLLANELVTVPGREYDLGLVPHWSDKKLARDPRFTKYNPIIINPDADPLQVILEIGMCRKIVSSSLHGIVLADAFGIPRRIEMTDRFKNEGGDFKFRDHNAAVNVPHAIGLTQSAARYDVQTRQHELYDMLILARKLLMGVN